jgi:hypothetical protein
MFSGANPTELLIQKVTKRKENFEIIEYETD